MTIQLKLFERRGDNVSTQIEEATCYAWSVCMFSSPDGVFKIEYFNSIRKFWGSFSGDESRIECRISLSSAKPAMSVSQSAVRELKMMLVRLG